MHKIWVWKLWYKKELNCLLLVICVIMSSSVPMNHRSQRGSDKGAGGMLMIYVVSPGDVRFIHAVINVSYATLTAFVQCRTDYIRVLCTVEMQWRLKVISEFFVTNRFVLKQLVSLDVIPPANQRAATVSSAESRFGGRRGVRLRPYPCCITPFVRKRFWNQNDVLQ